MNIETANRLYELRKQQGLSQEELAEKLGVSRQAVSKWERSEASPDTDNLISLAKLFNLTLDELIYGEKKETNKENSANSEEATANDQAEEEVKGEEKEKKSKTEINVGPGGIFIEDEDGDTVKINLSGIKIQKTNPLFDSEDNEDDDDEDSEDAEFVEYDDEDVVVTCADGEIKVKKVKKGKFWRDIPYPIICALAYLVFGFCDICGGWSLSWIVFLTIPIYYSLVDAICVKRFDEFEYPILTVFLYLYIGLYHGNWHPHWLVFITIPIYSCIASSLDKVIKKRSKKIINHSE